MNKQIEDLLAVYALGGLTEDEKRQVETYVDANPTAKAELDNYLQVVDALILTAVPIQPSPNIAAELFARVEADAQLRDAFVADDSVAVVEKRPFSPPAQQYTPSI